MRNKVENKDLTSNDARAERLWCIKVKADKNCWIADWDGDPGRTLVRKNAKTFINKSDAEKLCSKIKLKYPDRIFWVDVF